MTPQPPHRSPPSPLPPLSPSPSPSPSLHFPGSALRAGPHPRLVAQLLGLVCFAASCRDTTRPALACYQSAWRPFVRRQEGSTCGVAPAQHLAAPVDADPPPHSVLRWLRGKIGPCGLALYPGVVVLLYMAVSTVLIVVSVGVALTRDRVPALCWYMHRKLTHIVTLGVTPFY